MLRHCDGDLWEEGSASDGSVEVKASASVNVLCIDYIATQCDIYVHYLYKREDLFIIGFANVL